MAGAVVILMIKQTLAGLLHWAEFGEADPTVAECEIEIEFFALGSLFVVGLRTIGVETRVALVDDAVHV